MFNYVVFLSMLGLLLFSLGHRQPQQGTLQEAKTTCIHLKFSQKHSLHYIMCAYHVHVLSLNNSLNMRSTHLKHFSVILHITWHQKKYILMKVHLERLCFTEDPGSLFYAEHDSRLSTHKQNYIFILRIIT